jgi:hypothetical protein
VAVFAALAAEEDEGVFWALDIVLIALFWTAVDIAGGGGGFAAEVGVGGGGRWGGRGRGREGVMMILIEGGT